MTMFKKYNLLLLLVLVSFKTFAFIDPYRVLGIAKNATDKEIGRACRRLLGKTHPDNPNNGGNSADYVKVAQACAKLKGKDEQCSRSYEVCSCSPEKTGICMQPEDSAHLYCNCDVSFSDFPFKDKSGQTDSSFNKKEDTSEKQDTKKDFFESFFRKFRSFNFNWDDDTDTLKYEASFFFLSSTTQSPVFRLAFEESLKPHIVEECVPHTAHYAFAPFAQVEKVHFFDGHCDQDERGLIFRWHYKLLGIDLDYIGSISGKRYHFFHRNDETLASNTVTRTHVGFSDAIFGIGKIVTGPLGWGSLKGLFGLSGLHKDSGVSNDFIVVPHLSAGLRADSTFLFTPNDYLTYTLHTAVRWLHFFKRDVTINDYRKDPIGHFKTEPGNYVDLLITFDTTFDPDEKHHFILSYNPTFAHSESRNETIENSRAKVNIRDLSPRGIQHSFAFKYSYDSSLFSAPISITLGYLYAFSHTGPAEHRFHQHNSTFWASLAYAV